MRRNGNDNLWQQAETALWNADWAAARGAIDELIAHHTEEAVDCLVTIDGLKEVGIACPEGYREVLDCRIKAWNEACGWPMQLEIQTIENRPATH